MKQAKTTLTLALGTAFGVSLAMGTAAQAAGNPFAMQSLDRGYMVADSGGKMGDGKCGNMATDKADEGKCGGMKKDAVPAKEKSMDGKCAANTKKVAPPKTKEGKCGEGKCGAGMKS